MEAPVTQTKQQNNLVAFIPRQERQKPLFQMPLLDALPGNEAIMLARGRIEGKIEGFGEWLRARNGHPLNPDNKEVSGQLAGIADSMAEYKRAFGNHLPAYELRALFTKTATEAIVANEMHKFSKRVEAVQSKGYDLSHYALTAESVANVYAVDATAQLDAALTGHIEAKLSTATQAKVA